MLPNHLYLCHSLLLLASVFLSIRVFSNESALCIRWPKYWNFSISPSNEIQGWFHLELTGLILLSKGISRVLSSTTIQKHQFFSAQPSLCSNSHICTWLLEKTLVNLCPVSFCTSWPNLPYSRFLLTSYFCIPITCDEKDIFFWC